MATGATAGTATGAASGAVSGAALGTVLGAPIVGTAIGAVVGGVAGFLGGSAQDSSQANATAWQQYNNQMGTNVTLANLRSQQDLTLFNVSMLHGVAGYNAEQARTAAAYNAALITATTEYNSLLLDAQLESLWEANDLDLLQLNNFKMRERGSIIADQAASGTVIGDGSNADVVISQEAQRALDANVIMFNADQRANDIMNRRAQGEWQGAVAAQRTIWEGDQAAAQYRNNASAQASSMQMDNAISTSAGMRSAYLGLMTGNASINLNSESQSAQNTQNLVNGMFAAAGQATAFAGTYANVSSTPETTFSTAGGARLPSPLEGSRVRSAVSVMPTTTTPTISYGMLGNS